VGRRNAFGYATKQPAKPERAVRAFANVTRRVIASDPGNAFVSGRYCEARYKREFVGKLDAFKGRISFSCGWHITLHGQDVYSLKLKTLVKVFGPLARLARFADLDDQVEAARRIFASDKRWTVVRGSDLEEGESQGLPVWSRHVGDPILESNITRRVDFALFMVEALDNDELVHEAPAIVGRQAPSALAYAD
jgi:hypothetical protein